MAFSSLSPTQFVSDNNLQDAVTTSVLTLHSGQTIPVNNRFITKQNLLTYVNVDPTNTYLAAKTNLQWVAKRDITASSGSHTNILIIVENSYGTSTGVGSFDSILGLTGFVLGTSVTSSNSPTTGIYSSASSTLSIDVTGTKIGDGIDIYVNAILIERIATPSRYTYITSSYTLSSLDVIEFICNNNL